MKMLASLLAVAFCAISADAYSQACIYRRFTIGCVGCSPTVAAYAMYYEAGHCYLCDYIFGGEGFVAPKSSSTSLQCKPPDVFHEMQRLNSEAAEFTKVVVSPSQLLAIAQENASVADMISGMQSTTTPAFNIRRGGMLVSHMPTFESFQARLQSFGESADGWVARLPAKTAVEVKYTAISLTDEAATIRMEAAVVDEDGLVLQNLPGVIELDLGPRSSGSALTQSATAPGVAVPTFVRSVTGWRRF